MDCQNYVTKEQERERGQHKHKQGDVKKDR